MMTGKDTMVFSVPVTATPCKLDSLELSDAQYGAFVY